MGTTVSNFHVLVGNEDSGAQHRVASAIAAPSLVSPVRGGWISVFPFDETMVVAGDAPAVSERLRRPCVTFYCFDSDLAMATLFVDGRSVGQLAIAWPGLWEEMGFPPPAGHPVEGLESTLEVVGDLDLWVKTLGRGSRSELIAAVAADSECPFADGVAASVLGALGIDSARLTSSFRHYELGEQPEDSATFVRVGT